jgi:hypothetical protein
MSKLINNPFMAMVSQQCCSRGTRPRPARLARGQVCEAVPVVVRRNMQNAKKRSAQTLNRAETTVYGAGLVLRRLIVRRTDWPAGCQLGRESVALQTEHVHRHHLE